MKAFVSQLLLVFVASPLIGLAVGAWVTLVLRGVFWVLCALSGVAVPSWLAAPCVAVGAIFAVIAWFMAWQQVTKMTGAA